MQRISLFALRGVIALIVLAIGAVAVLAVIRVGDERTEEPDAGIERTVPDRVGLHPGLISEDSAALFDQETLRTYSFDVAPEDLEFLDDDPAAEQYVPATMRVDGLLVGPVGLRYKGSVGAFVDCTEQMVDLVPSGAKTCTKLSMKVKLTHAVPGQEFYGVRRLQLHSQNLDPTHLRERLGYWMFAEMGVVASRSVHARVEVNGEFLGLFALTENVDGRFVRDRFADGSGNLYKGDWPITSGGNVRAEDQLLATLETNENDAGVSADMIRAFAADVVADPATAPDALRRWTDLDRLLASFVVDRAIRHDDGPLHWYCDPDRGCGNGNFYWYEEPATGLVHLVPWDLDGAFQNLGDDVNVVTWVADDFGEVRNDCEPFLALAGAFLQRSAACDPLIAAAASFEPELAALERRFVEGPLADADERIATWVEQIEPVVAEAAARHADAISVEDWHAAVASLRADLGLTTAG